jgi:hypothetical protein
MVVGGERLGERSSDMYLPLLGGSERAAVVPPMHVRSSKPQLGNAAEHCGRPLYIHTTAAAQHVKAHVGRVRRTLYETGQAAI